MSKALGNQLRNTAQIQHGENKVMSLYIVWYLAEYCPNCDVCGVCVEEKMDVHVGIGKSIVRAQFGATS